MQKRNTNILRLLIALLLISIVISSTGQNQKTRLACGIVLNATSGEALEGVHVTTKVITYSVVSLKSGYFGIRIPSNTDSLIFSRKGYSRKIIPYRWHDRRIKVKMLPLVPDSADLPQLKNTISFMPLKLISGGLEFRLERFVKMKHSVGAYVLWYFRGRQMFGSEVFTGYKIVPNYRFYFFRNKSVGSYIQASAIIAYYDFSKLNYQMKDNHEKIYSVQESFLTGGGGFAIGVTDIVGNSKHFILDINMGYQILPAIYPTSITVNGTNYLHSNAWWYLGGPGSVLEIKFSIGGIF